MTILLRYFASAREASGLDAEEVELDEGSEVAALLALVCARHPLLKPLAPTLRVAVGSTFVPLGHALAAGDIVALIPPVGGG
jgi:molybdopterin converting factor small subunit